MCPRITTQVIAQDDKFESIIFLCSSSPCNYMSLQGNADTHSVCVHIYIREYGIEYGSTLYIVIAMVVLPYTCTYRVE